MHSPSSSSTSLSPTTTTTTPALAPSLEGLVHTVQCQVCLGLKPGQTGRCLKRLTGVDDIDGLPGRIVKLPGLADIDTGSCVYQQLARDSPERPLNDTAFSHPCLILAQSPCGHQVFCAPVTSFGGMGIRAKYCGQGDWAVSDTIRQKLNEYVSLQLITDEAPEAHNNLGTAVYTGDKLREQSFAHLEFGFWIEWRNLDKWDGRRKLSAAALSRVAGLYCQAEFGRQQRGGSSSLVRLNRSPVRSAASSASSQRSLTPPPPSPPAVANLSIQSSLSSPHAATSEAVSPSPARYIPPYRRDTAPSPCKQAKMVGRSWRLAAA